MIIVFEGVDHSFKETNSKRLAEYYTGLGKQCNIYSFPNYNSPISGDKIKRVLNGNPDNLTQVEIYKLFFHNMMESVPSIYDDISNNCIVIIDRYKYSNMAYNYNLKDVAEVYDISNMLPDPDIIIFMDMNPRQQFYSELLKTRAEESGTQLDDNESNIDKICEAYDNYKKVLSPLKNVYYIECNEGERIIPEDKIFNLIYKAVRHHIIIRNLKNKIANIGKAKDRIAIHTNKYTEKSNPELNVSILDISNYISSLSKLSIFDSYTSLIDSGYYRAFYAKEEAVAELELIKFTDFYFSIKTNSMSKLLSELATLINVKYTIIYNTIEGNNIDTIIKIGGEDIDGIMYCDTDSDLVNNLRQLCYSISPIYFNNTCENQEDFYEEDANEEYSNIELSGIVTNAISTSPTSTLPTHGSILESKMISTREYGIKPEDLYLAVSPPVIIIDTSIYLNHSLDTYLSDEIHNAHKHVKVFKDFTCIKFNRLQDLLKYISVIPNNRLLIDNIFKYYNSDGLTLYNICLKYNIPNVFLTAGNGEELCEEIVSE